MSSNAKVIYGALVIYAIVAVLFYLGEAGMYTTELRDLFTTSLFYFAVSMALVMWVTGFVLLIVEAFTKQKTGRFRTAGGSFILGGVLILLIGTSLCFGAIAL